MKLKNKPLKSESVYKTKENSDFLIMANDNSYRIFTDLAGEYQYIRNPVLFKDFLDKAEVFGDPIKLDAEKFKNFYSDAHCFSVSRANLELILKFCLNDDTRYFANGFIYKDTFLIASDAITLLKLATDNFLKIESKIFPRLAVSRLLAMSTSLNFTFAFGDKEETFTVSGSDMTLQGKTISGHYPPWECIDEREYDAKGYFIPLTKLAVAEQMARPHCEYPMHDIGKYHYNENLLKRGANLSLNYEQETGAGMLRFIKGDSRAYVVPTRF